MNTENVALIVDQFKTLKNLIANIAIDFICDRKNIYRETCFEFVRDEIDCIGKGSVYVQATFITKATRQKPTLTQSIILIR